jgi:hypothetical protein
MRIARLEAIIGAAIQIVEMFENFRRQANQAHQETNHAAG